MLPPEKQRLPMMAATFASVFSGLAAAFSHAPHGIWVLIFFAYSLLFLALNGQGLLRGLLLGLIQGMTLYAFSLWWMPNVFEKNLAYAIAVWLAMTSFCALGAALVGWVSKHYPHRAWMPVLAAATLLMTVHFRSEVFVVTFPWITPGLALGPIVLTPILGVYGCGFLVILSCSLIVLGRRIQRAAGLALALALAAAALARTGKAEEQGEPVPVLAVQGGWEAVRLPRALSFVDPSPRSFWNYWRRTVASDFRDGIVVWPETASSALRESDTKMDAIRHLTKSRQSVFVIGTTQRASKDKFFNEAITFDHGTEVGSHRKVCPVPFIEHCEAGTTSAPIKTSRGILGTPICFDTHLEGPMRAMASAGAELFIVPSRDDLKWSASQHQQHAEILRHRALENDRWIAVANMHGISQIIDPRGNRVASMKSGSKGLLKGSVCLRNGRTLYNSGFWIIPYLLTGTCVLSYVSLFAHRLKES